MNISKLLDLLPDELKAQMGEVVDQVNAKVEEALKEEAVPLSETPGGREIDDLLNQAGPTIAHELLVYSHLSSVRRYQPRIMVFTPEKKSKRVQWVRSAIEPASADMLLGGVSHLRGLCNSVRVAEHPKAIAIWIAPVPTPEGFQYLLYAMHGDGVEVLILTDGKAWRTGALGPRRVTLMLESLLNTSRHSEERWNAVMGSLMTMVRPDLRVDLDAFIKKCAGEELTDELFDEFLTMVYERKDNLLFVKEVARSMAGPILREAQLILTGNVEQIERVLVDKQEQTAHIKKNHERAERRFKTDLQKHKAVREVAVKRAQQLERENRSLKKQLATADANGAAPADENTLGLALDRFFA